MQALKEENRRLKEALEWAAEEMQTGTSRWFESSEPGRSITTGSSASFGAARRKGPKPLDGREEP
jgi:hypothetical protein